MCAKASFPPWIQKLEGIFPFLKTCSSVNTGEPFIYLPNWWPISNFHWSNSRNVHTLRFLKYSGGFLASSTVKQTLHFQHIDETPCYQLSNFCPNYLNQSCDLRWSKTANTYYKESEPDLYQMSVNCIRPQNTLDAKPLFMCKEKLHKSLSGPFGCV